MNPNIKRILPLIAIAFVTGMWVMYMVQNQSKIDATENIQTQPSASNELTTDNKFSTDDEVNESNSDYEEISIEDYKESQVFNSDDISDLTDERIVIAYLKKHNKLPDYYITKNQARKKGWVANQGNLCDVLPGKAIGGDRFGNREGRLPKKSGRQYFEADLNYDCGRRKADRVVYSNDGLVYLTKDHYKTFQKQ